MRKLTEELNKTTAPQDEDAVVEIKALLVPNQTPEQKTKAWEYSNHDNYPTRRLTRYVGFFIHKGYAVTWSYNNEDGVLFNEETVSIEQITR